MAIKIKCGKCEAKFSVKDAAAGRRVKCRKCGVPIKVPVPKTDEEELLNFDAAAYGDAPSGDDAYGDDVATGTQPLPRRRKKKRTGSKSVAAPDRKWDLENPMLWFVVPVAAAVLVFLTSMMHLRIGGIMWMLIGAVAGFVAFICCWKILSLAFAESGLTGLLCLFVPFYILYFVATEWHATKKMFLVQVVAGLTLIVTEVSFDVAFAIRFTEAISTYNENQEREVQDTEDAPNGNNAASEE
ncbi:MAG: hypothetical protein ABGZ53_08185 [Fuerstiella sp.]